MMNDYCFRMFRMTHNRLMNPAPHKRGRPGLRRGPLNRWSPEEDSRLLLAIATHGTSSWHTISVCVGSKCVSSCYQRYHRVLNPHLRKGPFDSDEFRRLALGVLQEGEQWAKVAELLPGRTDTQCRARWMQVKRKRGAMQQVLYKLVYEAAATDRQSVMQQLSSEEYSTHLANFAQDAGCESRPDVGMDAIVADHEPEEEEEEEDEQDDPQQKDDEEEVWTTPTTEDDGDQMNRVEEQEEQEEEEDDEEEEQEDEKLPPQAKQLIEDDDESSPPRKRRRAATKSAKVQHRSSSTSRVSRLPCVQTVADDPVYMMAEAADLTATLPIIALLFANSK